MRLQTLPTLNIPRTPLTMSSRLLALETAKGIPDMDAMQRKSFPGKLVMCPGPHGVDRLEFRTIVCFGSVSTANTGLGVKGCVSAHQLDDVAGDCAGIARKQFVGKPAESRMTEREHDEPFICQQATDTDPCTAWHGQRGIRAIERDLRIHFETYLGELKKCLVQLLRRKRTARD